jgi:hypothetical protein
MKMNWKWAQMSMWMMTWSEEMKGDRDLKGMKGDREVLEMRGDREL